jgi:hypothetical protein
MVSAVPPWANTNAVALMMVDVAQDAGEPGETAFRLNKYAERDRVQMVVSGWMRTTFARYRAIPRLPWPADDSLRRADWIWPIPASHVLRGPLVHHRPTIERPLNLFATTSVEGIR